MAKTYTHFDTIEECDQFVRNVINVVGRCCGGKGACIYTTTFYFVMNNPKQFPEKPKVGQKHTKHTEDTVCCVCYEDSEEITPCGHLVCKTCLRLVGPCPCCRQPLF